MVYRGDLPSTGPHRVTGFRIYATLHVKANKAAPTLDKIFSSLRLGELVCHGSDLEIEPVDPIFGGVVRFLSPGYRDICYTLDYILPVEPLKIEEAKITTLIGPEYGGLGLLCIQPAVELEQEEDKKSCIIL